MVQFGTFPAPLWTVFTNVIPWNTPDAACRVSVNFCVAFGVLPFAAFRHSVYVPGVAPAVAATLPVPSWLSTNETPVPANVDGEQPLKLAFVSVGVGKPVVVTANVAAVPEVNVVELALVKVGATVTV